MRVHMLEVRVSLDLVCIERARKQSGLLKLGLLRKGWRQVSSTNADLIAFKNMNFMLSYAAVVWR